VPCFKLKHDVWRCIFDYMTNYSQLLPDITVILCSMSKAWKVLQWYLHFKEGISPQLLIHIIWNKVHWKAKKEYLTFFSIMLSVISTLYSTTLQIIQNCQTLQCFLSPLYFINRRCIIPTKVSRRISENADCKIPWWCSFQNFKGMEEDLLIMIYSGLRKHCNFWQFWITCSVVLYSVDISLSIAERK
jgi:hypothetical protein